MQTIHLYNLETGGCYFRKNDGVIIIKDHTFAESMPKVPVLILNGFLGSGKTTLLTSLLVQSHKRQLSIGVVVNDMSELDVDRLLVA